MLMKSGSWRREPRRSRLKTKYPSFSSDEEEDPVTIVQLKVSDDLSKLLNNEQFSDIKFVLKRSKLLAHKAVLYARCPVFFSKFEYTMIQNSVNDIDITGLEDEVFQEFLRFIYSGIVKNIDNVSKKLIDIAEKYALNDLKNLCSFSLNKNLNVDNAVETLILANQLNAEQLKLSALKFINQNAVKVISTEGYKVLVKSHPNLLDQLYQRIFVPTGPEMTPAPTTADTKLAVSVDIGKLVNDKRYSDVKIILKDSTLYAHKAILSSRSSVFSAMFQHDMTENSTNEVHITDIRDEVFQELLKFMYSGIINNIDNVSSELLVAAEKYDLEDLKNLCSSSLTNILSVDNAAETLILADRVNATNLKLSAMKYINERANSIFPTNGYKLLAKSHMYLIEELYRHQHGAVI